MARRILLDAGVVGLLCSTPDLPNVSTSLQWLARLAASKADIAIPDITDYEVRRELNRSNAFVKLSRLKTLRSNILIIPVTSEAWEKAAEFWALVGRTGRPTADPHALDGDAILAGIAATTGEPSDVVTIATTNVEHLARFPGIDARQWQSIID